MVERTDQVGTDIDVNNDVAPRPVERDADQIAADISRTREEITQTVDEIQRKISPDELLQETLDTIRDVLSENSARVREIIKQHPLATALVGVGIGWLFLQGYGSTSGRAYSTRRYATDYAGTGRTVSDTMTSAASSVKDAAASARDKAGQIAEQAAHLAGRVKDQASHIADQVKSQTGQIADQAKSQAQYVTDVARDQAVKAKDQFWSMVNDNPLGIAAMGLALGAAIGLLLPATRTEDELMGETRDDLAEKAKNVAEAATSAAQEEAKKQGLTQEGGLGGLSEKVQNVAQAATGAAKDEAKKEGLTQESLSEKARNIADAAKEAAREESHK